MTIPYWADNDPTQAAAWNTVRLGSVQIPGLCVVKAKKGRKLDTKQAKGQDGYKSKDNGATEGTVTITVTIATREQWEEWQKVRPLIDPNRPGATRNPMEIKHPEAQDRGIKNVYVTEIEGDPPTARAGKRFTVQCKEWFPSTATAKGASKDSKALPAAAPRQNSFISQMPGETQLGQDFINTFAGNF